MTQFNNAMEIFKLLDKSNCRDCNEATCLAFAGAVFQGRKQLEQCTHLEPATIAAHSDSSSARTAAASDMEAALAQLQQQVGTVDLKAAADRLGGRFQDGTLILKIMGKDFRIDGQGNLASDIHIHTWITGPVLNYVINGAGVTPVGKWVPFRELNNGQQWQGLFGQQCEKPLKRIADTYPDLLEDMIHLFNGKKMARYEDADISLVLHPLPKVPVLFCYWKPEDGLASSMNLFFDASVEKNLNIESTYTLGVGLVRMFEKLALRHG